MKSEDTEDLGAGSGVLPPTNPVSETLSRGRAPLELGRVLEAVEAAEICSEVFRRIIGFGRSVTLGLDELFRKTASVETDFSRGVFFCFSKCLAMASTSAKVESN